MQIWKIYKTNTRTNVYKLFQNEKWECRAEKNTSLKKTHILLFLGFLVSSAVIHTLQQRGQTGDCISVQQIVLCAFVYKHHTYWFDIFNSALKSLENILSLSCALGVRKCLCAEAVRVERSKDIQQVQLKHTMKG